MLELLYQEQSHSTFNPAMAVLEEVKEMSMQTASHFLPEAQNQLPGSSLPQSTTLEASGACQATPGWLVSRNT